MQSNYGKAVLAGIVGAVVMSLVGLYGAPMMGMARMNPADMMAMQMGGSMAVGWAAHIMIGAILAVIYLAVAATRLPGPPAVRGAIFSMAPWLVAMVVMMPMMGMGMFGGGMQPAVGSLIGHMIYGLVMGGIIGEPRRVVV